MRTVSLAAYTVRARKRGEKNQYLPLGQLDPGDLFDYLEEFLRSLRNPTPDLEDKTLLWAKKPVRKYPRARRFEGIIETGEYGYEADLFDIDHRVVSHRRKVAEAELLPFYFLAHLPLRANQGILILQRFGNLGMKAVLEAELRKFFKATDYLVEMHPLMPEQVVKKWTTARKVSRLRLVSFRIPDDIARAFSLGDREEVASELVITIKRRGKLPLPTPWRRWLERRGEDQGMVEVREESPKLPREYQDWQQQYGLDTVKMVVNVGGKRRTVDATNLEKMEASFDVTESVNLGADGHPTLISLHEAAFDLLRDLKKEIQDFQWVPRHRGVDTIEHPEEKRHEGHEEQDAAEPAA